MKLEISPILVISILLSACNTNKAQQWLNKQPTASSLQPKIYKDVNLV